SRSREIRSSAGRGPAAPAVDARPRVDASVRGLGPAANRIGLVRAGVQRTTGRVAVRIGGGRLLVADCKSPDAEPPPHVYPLGEQRRLERTVHPQCGRRHHVDLRAALPEVIRALIPILRAGRATTVALVVVLCGLAAPARADYLFTPFVGPAFAGNTVFHIDPPSGSTESLGTHVIFGGSAGWLSSGILGIEGDFAYAPHFLERKAPTSGIPASIVLSSTV